MMQRSLSSFLISGFITPGFLMASVLISTEVLAHENEDERAGHQQQVLHLAGSHPITLGAGITMVAQGTSGAATDTNGLTYSVDLAFESDLDDLGMVFVYINSAQGSAVNNTAATGANGDDESGADDTGFSDTRIAEAWYQMPIGDRLSLTLGKIDPTGIYDGNEVANDETTQFLADAFINNPTIQFPGYAAGASLAIEATDKLTVNIGAFEPTDDFAGTLNDSFVISELGLALTIGGQECHLRLIAWNVDGANRNDGWALNADQQISDKLAVFARYGVQDDTQDFDNAISLGAQWQTGIGIFGAAWSSLASTGLAGPDDEQQAEVYLGMPLNDNVVITADLQQVSNPNFSNSADDVTVFGVRVQIDL